MIATRTLDLLKFLGSSDPSAGLKEGYTWMQTASKEQYEAFIKEGGRMFCCTVGPLDGLLLPAGYTFVEKIGSGSDYFGVRTMWLSSTDESA